MSVVMEGINGVRLTYCPENRRVPAGYPLVHVMPVAAVGACSAQRAL